MSQLEPPDRSTDETDADETTVGETSSSNGSSRGSSVAAIGESGIAIELSADATQDEAAAVAAAIGAHLTDRQQAAATAVSVSDSTEYVDEWRFASKLRSLGKRRWTGGVEVGDEWKAAGRAFPR